MNQNEVFRVIRTYFDDREIGYRYNEEDQQVIFTVTVEDENGEVMEADCLVMAGGENSFSMMAYLDSILGEIKGDSRLRALAYLNARNFSCPFGSMSVAPDYMIVAENVFFFDKGYVTEEDIEEAIDGLCGIFMPEIEALKFIIENEVDAEAYYYMCNDVPDSRTLS